MFSGIVQEISKPAKSEKETNSLRLTFPIPSGWSLEEGESICMDGVCVTVEKLKDNAFSVFCMKETLDKSTFSDLPSSHIYNMERSLTLNSLIGGHLVMGHVDTTATIKEVRKNPGDTVITVSLPSQFTRYIVYKGSISLNGVSLTIVSVDDTTFSVSLIPYTLKHTNLGSLEKGDKVNIEVDMIAKYIEKLSQPREA